MIGHFITRVWTDCNQYPLCHFLTPLKTELLEMPMIQFVEGVSFFSEAHHKHPIQIHNKDVMKRLASGITGRASSGFLVITCEEKR